MQAQTKTFDPKQAQTKTVYPKHDRIIAIGDLHGDMQVLRLCLEDAAQVAVYDAKKRTPKWIGGDTFVVIVGDILDRFREDAFRNSKGWGEGEYHDEEYDMLQYINHLDRQARQKGGRIFKLLGNHEIMNVMEKNFDYVGLNARATRETDVHPRTGKIAQALHQWGIYGILQLGDWIFLHGGLLPSYVDKVTKTGPEKNFFTRITEAVRSIFTRTVTKQDKTLFVPKLNEDARQSDTMFWNDTFSSPSKEKTKSNEKCPLVDASFEALLPHMQALGYTKEDVNHLHMVVAHSTQTYQTNGYTYKIIDPMKTDDKRIATKGPAVSIGHAESYAGINYVCHGKVWRIDSAMSRAFDMKQELNRSMSVKQLKPYLFARQPQVLEIHGFETRILIARTMPSRQENLGIQKDQALRQFTNQDLEKFGYVLPEMA